MNNLSVINICKEYPGFKLKNISFDIPKGSIVGLIGENGAGKTTTIKAILNLINLSSGEVIVFGKDYQHNEKEIKDELGVVLVDSFLSDELTINDIGKIMINIHGKWNNELFDKYIVNFKLPRDKVIKEFSSGMLMKLKIVVALAHEPKLLILDEPTSGLDPIARNEVLDIFRDFIQDDEKSILVSSHITSDLEHIADKIIFINEGEIVLDKSRDELMDNYGIVKCSKDEFNKVDKHDYIKYKKNRYNYELLIDNKKMFKKKYDIKIIDKPTLDDVMIIMIKGDRDEKN